MKQRFTTFLAALFFYLSMALPASATVSDTGVIPTLMLEPGMRSPLPGAGKMI